MTTPLPIRFGPRSGTTLDDAAAREWLVADGLGGYAMGTVSGVRTRRYHGLLVVADGSPARRHLGLVSLDPVLVMPGGGRIPLGVHRWADGAVAPEGHLLLESFDLDDGLPRWRWRVGDVVIERELAMRHGTASLAVVHRLVAGGPVRLELDTVVTWRDAHGERGAWGTPPDVVSDSGGAVVENAFRLTGPGWSPGGEWWRGVQATAEAERGLSALEDVWHAGHFSAALDRLGDVVEVSAWAGDLDVVPSRPLVALEKARARAAAVVSSARSPDSVDARLVLAADSFVTASPDVVAGYPWFGAWSRDTMTSYEGLFLETGREHAGRRLLEDYALTLSEGMLANTADTGATEWNTVDATLWFVHAVDRHVARTGDTDLAISLLPGLDGIVEAHLRGTRFGIGVEPDGLLRAGVPGVALTWMDARVDGIGVTPRIGKPVEVNALWLHALAAIRRARVSAGKDDDDLRKLEQTGRASFADRFPLGGGRLRDVVDPDDGASSGGATEPGALARAAELRPNALLAAGLPDPPLPDAAVVRACAALLTPLGLRSLDPASAAFRPRHRGGPVDRDAAYHQGTVWPWLLGPYVDAALATGVDASSVLSGVEGHLLEAGLGSVSETADGAAPHDTTGCPFQAWSVAEVLRARRKLAAAGVR